MQAAAPNYRLLYLYGGAEPWDSSLWVTSDDRVRGGSSQSHLLVLNPEKARFYGHLDTSTLGGAGFASQHSLGILALDLSGYSDGIVIAVASTDTKRYALTLKDDIPPRRDDGREEAGISWEAEFVVGDDGSDPNHVYLPWSAFKPTYRGKAKPDAKPLDLSSIKRIGLMMRSFFGTQDGDFSIEIHAIAARKLISAPISSKVIDDDDDEDDLKDMTISKNGPTPQGSRLRSWFCGLG